MTGSEPLKPCPFCGGPPKQWRGVEDWLESVALTVEEATPGVAADIRTGIRLYREERERVGGIVAEMREYQNNPKFEPYLRAWADELERRDG